MPIVEPTDYLRLDVGKLPIDADLPEPPLDLVACFHSHSLFDAKLIADELAAVGIPSTLEKASYLRGASEGYPCRLMIRGSDHARALPIVDEFQERQRARPSRGE